MLLRNVRYLLLFLSVARADPSPALTVQLECLDAWKGGNLQEQGGGPMGAQWNTEAVVCEARIEGTPGDAVRSVHMMLQVGQGNEMLMVGELYVPAHPQRTLAMADAQSQAKSIQAAASPIRTFFIPDPLLARTLRKKSRQPGTGAEVYIVHFVLTARGLDGKGRVVARARDEVKSEFAFGE
ncbi:hypothetical protein D187_008464 [Cystobacter fuscus DSM 2262]|uniref:Lipoprotein n=1 Tax=Cystobacter fuscus (strain ATCC 25194 / DSM 2262 / NBRC 100088 / M29) TaxID=1242864 RepID=S9PIP2_CYSF2|nr:hypothetical protein D187_008464 [Cystobacter fuscus DSM 2262]